MKLEIKHLAPYLPYALLCTSNDNCFIEHPLEGLHNELDVAIFDFENGEQEFYLKDFKPILKPVSDLVKERLFYDIAVVDVPEFIAAVTHHQAPYYQTEYVIERHYDIFGLIDAGLAIDINTIKQQE